MIPLGAKCLFRSRAGTCSNVATLEYDYGGVYPQYAWARHWRCEAHAITPTRDNGIRTVAIGGVA